MASPYWGQRNGASEREGCGKTEGNDGAAMLSPHFEVRTPAVGLTAGAQRERPVLCPARYSALG